MAIFFIIAALLLYFGIKTYQKYLQNKSKRVLFFGIGIMTLGLASLSAGLEKAFFILAFGSGFILSINAIQIMCNSFGYLMINLFCLRVVFPKHEKKIFLFNLILSIIDVSFYFIFPPTPNYASYEVVFQEIAALTQLVFGIPVVLMIPIFLFYYSYIMRKQSPPHSKWSFWIGMATILIFFALYLKMFVPSKYADITRLLWIPAFLFWYICFTRFIEVDWPMKIRQIYIIMSNSGVCLRDYSFITQDLTETQLIGGAVTGVTMLIQEITKSRQRLQLMDQGDIKILLEYGQYIVCALITEANFSILRRKLKELVELFEQRYEEKLRNFTGSLDVFGDANHLIEMVFSYQELMDRSVFVK